jgi:hypothetical protein
MNHPCPGASEDGVRCTGTARPTPKDGRFYHWREIQIAVPAHIPIHRCDTCYRDWMDTRTQQEVYTALEESYQKDAELIQRILKNGTSNPVRKTVQEAKGNT